MGVNTYFTCSLCKTQIAITQSFELPGGRFNFLVGEPTICERCVAHKMGIEANWKEEIEKSIKPREVN